MNIQQDYYPLPRAERPPAIATLIDAHNFYAGRKVYVLTSQMWGEHEVCQVEIVGHPGLTTTVRRTALRMDAA